MDSLWSFFSGFWSSVVSLIGWVFSLFFSALQAFYYWTAMAAVNTALFMLEPVIGQVDFSPLVDLWNSAPPVFFDIANRVGLNDALTLIISAVGARIALAFIPKIKWPF